MTAPHKGVQPCDFCKDPVAPFGFAPPPGSGIQVRRPIKTCEARECRAQALDRRAALVARHDPFAATRTAPSAATSAPVPPPAQGSLF